MIIYELYFGLNRTSLFFQSCEDAEKIQSSTTASQGGEIRIIDVISNKCIWKKEQIDYDQIGEGWFTACDNAFQFICDGVKENRFKFCPYCGKEIEVKK